jgi:preprotein translocase subunit YajC
MTALFCMTVGRLSETPAAWVAAQAGKDGAPGGGGMHLLIMIGGCLAIIYFVMIRPNKQREKTRKEMLANIKKNDKVVTIGGIHGVVVSCKEKEVVLKTDESSNVRLRMARSAIARLESEPEEEAK